MTTPDVDRNMPEKENSSPSLVLRVLGLSPLFYGAYLLFVTTRISPQFEQMFREMDMGELPWRTNLLIRILNSGGLIIAGVLLVGAAIFYWTKASRAAHGLVWFNTISFIACQQAYWLVMSALFDPMIEIMKRIGK